MDYAVQKALFYRPGVGMVDFGRWIDARDMAASSISANGRYRKLGPLKIGPCDRSKQTFG